MTVKVVLLSDGEDPDSFARSHTRQEILDYLSEHEMDFISFKYSLLSGPEGSDPIRKAELIRDIIDTVAVIPDQIARSVYIEQCARQLSMKEDVLFAEVARIRRKRIESGRFEKQRREEAEARARAAEAAVADVGTGREEGYPTARAEDETMLKPVPLLEPAERELLYYLLKFGEYSLTFSDSQLYGAEAPVMRITVAEYISAQLQDDDLVLQNPLYRRIYDRYFVLRGELQKDGVVADSGPEMLQERIMQRFINGEDPQITAAVLDITVVKYELNVKEYLRAQIPERNTIDINVPKAVLVYKLKYVEHTCSLLMESLGHTSDPEEQQEAMHRLKLLLQIKNVLIKDLNRV